MNHHMHDWTIESVLFEWGLSKVTISTLNSELEKIDIVGEGVVDLRVPRRLGWGESCSINSTFGPIEQINGLKLFQIEIQSGDLIELSAGSFSLPF